MRDHGLLASALAPSGDGVRRGRLRDIDHKAAALLHSLATNHPLVDGNERLALAATLAFYGMNGLRVTLTNDEAYTHVMGVARGEQHEIGQIAALLKRTTTPR